MSAPCPQCGAALPTDPRFVSWCEACDWNLEPRGARQEEEKPRQRRGRERALRRAQRLHDEMVRRGTDEAGVDAGRVLTYGLAVIVLAIPVALFGLGVLLLVASGFTVVGIVLAMVIIATAIVARPRFGRRPAKSEATVGRAAAPALYAVLDRLALATAARVPVYVVVDGDYNAATRFVGLRRRVELRIGMPLWAVLDDPERIAVLAHEMAHQSNGDSAHSLVVGGAMGTLVELQLLFAPSRVFHHASIGAALSELVRGGFAALLRGVRRGMELLLARPHQRAEYRADALAARVAGGEAMARTLGALLLADSCRFAVQRARSRGSEEDALSIVRAHVEALPAREQERLRRVAARQGSRVDASHPPTPLRMEWVTRLGGGTAQVAVSPAESAAVSAELRDAWARRR
ncbi:MAG TPA: M48 family metalloprotease [Candidatus Angelobacter sp.]|nr:M48 family metalloprotease [Candidatus Angelobacter sp.]